jgi:hypothetical protein
MASFVDEAKEVDRVAFNLITKVEGKGLGAAAGKTVWADVIATARENDFARFFRNLAMERIGKIFRGFAIAGFLAGQIVAKKPAEDRLHRGCPNTCANVSPESAPDVNASNRRVRSSLISSSVRESSSRLSIRRRAKSARSAGERESASSAMAEFVNAMSQGTPTQH